MKRKISLNKINEKIIERLNFKEINAGYYFHGTKWDINKFSKMSNEYRIPIDWLIKEVPQSKIYLDTFYMSSIPITVEMIMIFFENQKSLKIPEEIIKNTKKGNLNFPAYPIDYEIALNFCEWLSVITGEHYDLPTEFEWEKAARGHKDDREFPWGNDLNLEYINSKENDFNGVIDVKSIKENKSIYDIYDLSGNVEEWTKSKNSPYSKNKIKFLNTIDYPILRGGTCEHNFDLARCSRRHGRHPSYFRGFRIVKRKNQVFEKKSIKVDHINIGDLVLTTIKTIENNKIYISPINEKEVELLVLEDDKTLSIYNQFQHKDSEILIKIIDITESTIKCIRPTIAEIDMSLKGGFQ